MQIAPSPHNEQARLQSLVSFKVLDTEVEARYDELTAMAANICDVPICLISLVDETRQWFKSHHGLDARETPRELAFCSHAILGNDIMEINNAAEDERFFDNPLVTGGPKIQFYAGMPLTDLAQHNLGTLCVIDSKPRKLTEQQRIALRTIANQVITNFELRRALDNKQHELRRAEEVARSKSIFMANVSHEIQNPLQGISGATEMLKTGNLSERQQRLLNLLDDSGKALALLMVNVADLAKIEAGAMRVMREPFSLPELLQQLGHLHQPPMQANNNQLSIVLDNDLPTTVCGDANRLKQVLEHLLRQAGNATSGGNVCLHASVLGLDQDTVSLEISVADSGLTIPPEILANLFQRFEQTEARNAGVLGSTGIGLAIANKLTQLMGGSLMVSAVPTGGTVFNLRLALATS